MRKIDRFDKYMKLKGLNDNKVTIQLSLSNGTLGKSRKEGRDLSSKIIEQILNFYTDLSKVWLLTGEGEMIKEETSTSVTPPVEDTSLLQQLVDSLRTTIETQKMLLDIKNAEIERLQRALFDKEAK